MMDSSFPGMPWLLKAPGAGMSATRGTEEKTEPSCGGGREGEMPT